MGGAIYTLADFAFAVASNGFSQRAVVSVSCSISYLAAARGETLTAEARRVKEGRSTAFYTVDVADDTGAKVAVMTVTGFIK